MISLVKSFFRVSGLLIFIVVSNLNAAQSQAEEIMLNAYRYIGSMDKYAFEADVNDNLDVTGPASRLYKLNVSAKVKRPGSFHIDVIGDRKERSSYLNNGVYTIFDHGSRYYGQIEMAKTIDETLDMLDEKYGINPVLSALLYSDMDRRTDLHSGKYFGKMNVDGVECDYVAFKHKNSVVHIWIASGDKPLIKSYRIIETTDDKTINSGGSLKWNDESEISESDFIFNAPNDAEKISINSANK